jgi:hypothetical protein
MNKNSLKTMLGDGSISLKAARRSALRGRESFGVPTADGESTEIIGHEQVLVDVYLFILVSFGWNSNPLAALRNYFPEFEWRWVAIPDSQTRISSFITRSNMIWICGTGVVLAVKKDDRADDRCHVVSEVKVNSSWDRRKAWIETGTFAHPLLDPVYISIWRRGVA